MTHLSLKDKILSTIRTRGIPMRPRWQFVFQTALWAFGLLLSVLVLLYLVSFIVFALRETGAWFAPQFGWRGMRIFIHSLPWLVVVVSIVILGIVEILVRRYAFAYRRPVLYSLGGVVLLLIVGTGVISLFGFHRGIASFTRHHPFSMGDRMYRSYGERHFSDVFAGTVIAMRDTGFDLERSVGERLQVTVTPQTRFPMGVDVTVGDRVVVLGDLEDDTILALGIRRIDSSPYEGFVGRERRDRFPSMFGGRYR